MGYINIGLRRFVCMSLLGCALNAVPASLTLAVEPTDEAWLEALESIELSDGLPLFEVIRHEETGAIELDYEMSRAELVVSIITFQNVLLEGAQQIERVDADRSVHSWESASYIIDIVSDLSAELFTVGNCLSSAQDKTMSGYLNQDMYATHELPAQFLSDVESSSTYVEAMQTLFDLAIDMTLVDGQFHPDQPLTQAQYLSILRQLDRFWANHEFGLDSLVIGYPNYRSGTPIVREELDATLGDILTRLTNVRSLIDEYCTQEVVLSINDKTADKSYDLETVEVLQSNRVQIAQGTRDGQEALYVLLEDDRYESIRRYAEDLMRANEALDLEVTFSRGEAAFYIVQIAKAFWNTLGKSDETLELQRRYSIAVEELEYIEQRLQSELESKSKR